MAQPRETPRAEKLATPAKFLPGVGPRRAPLVERLGLKTARDVLFQLPRGYQDLTDLRTVVDLEDDVLVSVAGTIEEIDQRTTSSGGTMLGVLLRDEKGAYLRALWFNQPTMRRRFAEGDSVLFSGKPKFEGGRWEMVHPRVESLDDLDGAAGRLLPLYPLTEGLSQGEMRRIVAGAIEGYVELLDEVFPEPYRREHNLLPLQEAVGQIHFPEDHRRLEQARRRLIYQELLILQLALALRRHAHRTGPPAPKLAGCAKIDARIRRLLPFELTEGQRQAIAEIAADMAGAVPMHRLLHGEVGSGKTVVAVYAMLVAVAHGYQAALMAPTEVLAMQHDRTLHALLAGSKVRCGLLTGSVTGKARERLIEQIGRGEIDVIVGTHAVIGPQVSMDRLGLVVIDEQHKFGVRQRAQLKGAGTAPHYLVMTATPIPRTVAMTQFGDLDISTLRDRPAGTPPVGTYLVSPELRERWWEFFRKKLREGRQGYVITPVVEESDTPGIASLEASYELLANGPLEAFRLSLLHGRMSAAEKDATMQGFRTGEVQVLVATSVVEVGIDVPNATVMTIESAERFGLAALHQLRGRVRRGHHPGFCGVFSEAGTEEARLRLAAFAESDDGFHLAEVDYRMRGPGNVLGTKQHGLPPLRIADLARDTAMLDEARADAVALCEQDPLLSRPEYRSLRDMVHRRYGRSLELGDVG